MLVLTVDGSPDEEVRKPMENELEEMIRLEFEAEMERIILDEQMKQLSMTMPEFPE